MTNYAEVNGSILIQYPYTFESLQNENPYTNFGGNTDVLFWFPQTNASIELGYSLVDVITLPQPQYDPTHQNCTLNQLPTLIDGIWTIGWTVSNFTPEQQKEYDDQQKKINKNQAEYLLSATDWTAIPSVADPAQSNPYLANQNAFFEYRNKIRQIAINPPVIVDQWPTEPVEIWETAPTA